MQIRRDHILTVMTAHPDTGEIAIETPTWLCEECAALGLVEQKPNGMWGLADAGWKMRRDAAG